MKIKKLFSLRLVLSVIIAAPSVLFAAANYPLVIVNNTSKDITWTVYSSSSPSSYLQCMEIPKPGSTIKILANSTFRTTIRDSNPFLAYCWGAPKFVTWRDNDGNSFGFLHSQGNGWWTVLELSKRAPNQNITASYAGQTSCVSRCDYDPVLPQDCALTKGCRIDEGEVKFVYPSDMPTPPEFNKALSLTIYSPSKDYTTYQSGGHPLQPIADEYQFMADTDANKNFYRLHQPPPKNTNKQVGNTEQRDFYPVNTAEITYYDMLPSFPGTVALKLTIHGIRTQTYTDTGRRGSEGITTIKGDDSFGGKSAHLTLKQIFEQNPQFGKNRVIDIDVEETITPDDPSIAPLSLHKFIRLYNLSHF